MFTSKTKEAIKKLRNLFPATSLQFSKRLSERYEAKIFLKREDLTPVRSFKIRGAFNFISQLSNNEKKIGVVCASAGNHAQGFAFSCAYFKIKGIVFMPLTSPAQKVEKTRLFGKGFIEVKLIGDIFDETQVAALDLCKKEGKLFGPPFDHEKIIEGGATVGCEILEQIDQPIDFLITPVGGGGLSSGITEYFYENSPKTNIICAEPKGAAALKGSIKAGKVIKLDKIDTFVDGASLQTVGEKTFNILKKRLKDDVIAIPENRLCETILEFLFHDGIILEPAGGLSIDALKDIPNKIKGKTVVCILSGGNFDFERLPDVKERAMKYAGFKKYFILRLPQRPGALKEFLNLLGPDEDIARFEYLKKSTKNFGSVLLGIETKDPQNFSALFARMEKAGFGYQDVTNDEILADFVI